MSLNAALFNGISSMYLLLTIKMQVIGHLK